MEEIIEKTVTGKRELGVAVYLQCGRHSNVLYLASYLTI